MKVATWIDLAVSAGILLFGLLLLLSDGGIIDLRGLGWQLASLATLLALCDAAVLTKGRWAVTARTGVAFVVALAAAAQLLGAWAWAIDSLVAGLGALNFAWFWIGLRTLTSHQAR